MGTGSSHLDDLLLSEIFRTPRQPAPEAEPQYRKPSKLAPTMQPPARAVVKKGYKNEWEEDDDDDDEEEEDGGGKKVKRRKRFDNLFCAKCLHGFVEKKNLRAHVENKKCPGRPQSGFQCYRCGNTGDQEWMKRHLLEGHADIYMGHFAMFQ